MNQCALENTQGEKYVAKQTSDMFDSVWVSLCRLMMSFFGNTQNTHFGKGM